MTKTVIYFTIYDKLMLSRKLKIWKNNFLIDLDQENVKLISSGTSSAGMDKTLEMTLAPPGGRTELL